MAVDVCARLEVEPVEEILIPDRPRELHPAVGVGGADHTVEVRVAALRIADNEERVSRRARPIPADDDRQVVLRFETGNDEVVLVGSQAQRGEAVVVPWREHPGAIGDEHRLDAVGGPVVLLDAPCVGDQRVGCPHGYRLRPLVVALRPRAPLAAPPFDPVDVHRHRHPSGVEDRDQRSIGRVEHHGDVGGSQLLVEHRQERM